ncbi:MAG: hypothetical protein OXI71_14045 [Gemmatimonadota bacterium]|nr:hypothetical protein [Gemmatimonadota bacterium]
MTDATADLALMASIRRYQKVNGEVAMFRSRMREHSVILKRVLDACENIEQDASGFHAECEKVDWQRVSDDAKNLKDLIEEKHGIELVLREAGLASLIRPDWEVMRIEQEVE